MARVLKASDPEANGIVPVSHDQLLDFPPLEFPRPDFHPKKGGQPEVDTGDPETLRQHLLEEARKDAERMIEEARAKGYEQGLRSGEEAFSQAVSGAAQCLESAAAEIRRAREDFLDSLQNEVLDLAILIAERVLQREVRLDHHLVLNTTRRALAQLVDRQQVRIMVNPLDHEALRAHKITLLEDFEAIGQIEISPSDDVTPGGCIVETHRDYIDATIGSLLAKVLETLAD